MTRSVTATWFWPPASCVVRRRFPVARVAVLEVALESAAASRAGLGRASGADARTVMLTGGDLVDKPASSRARARSAYVPAARLVTVKLKGLVATRPTRTPLIMKFTFVTAPSVSVAEA